MELWIGALNLGFLYAFMAMGAFITFRVHDFPDITMDGSFTTGAATAAVLIAFDVNPLLAMAAAFVVGSIAGSVTGLIHTKLKINGLLAGILIMTGLYSINLHIMGRSNIPLVKKTTLFRFLEKLNPGLHSEIWLCLILCAFMILFWLAVSRFFKTDIGIATRVTGCNPAMASANGINVDRMTISGIALSNGLIGVSGSLVAQYQGFADIGMGIGTIVMGLASVIIGETVFKVRSFSGKVFSVIVGSIIFRLMIAAALHFGMNPIDLKLMTAVFVLLVLVSPKLMPGKAASAPGSDQTSGSFLSKQLALGIIVLIILAGFYLFGILSQKKDESASSVHEKKLALLLFSDNMFMTESSRGVMKSLNDSGVLKEHKIRVDLKNAQGEFSLAQSIAQDIVRQNYDYIITLSTLALQTMSGANKKIPHVFGAVTDPYSAGVAESPEVHQKNLAGVATFQPVESTLKIMRDLFPNAKKIGIVWNPSEACSEACTKKARQFAPQYGFELIEMTVNRTEEVTDATKALLGKDIDLFLTSGDNTVSLAAAPIAEILRKHKIPYFTNNFADIDLGSFISVGADYYEVGIETGNMAIRIINGEDPENIPIKNWVPEKISINKTLATEFGITLPKDFLARGAKVK